MKNIRRSVYETNSSTCNQFALHLDGVAIDKDSIKKFEEIEVSIKPYESYEHIDPMTLLDTFKGRVRILIFSIIFYVREYVEYDYPETIADGYARIDYLREYLKSLGVQVNINWNNIPWDKLDDDLSFIENKEALDYIFSAPGALDAFLFNNGHFSKEIDLNDTDEYVANCRKFTMANGYKLFTEDHS